MYHIQVADQRGHQIYGTVKIEAPPPGGDLNSTWLMSLPARRSGV